MLRAIGENIAEDSMQEVISRCIESFASKCKGKGFIAIDFDATIVQVHTYGRWSASAPALAAHVRPVFRAILKYGVENEDLHVGIVTFSGQVSLIRQVLVQRLVLVVSYLLNYFRL